MGCLCISRPLRLKKSWVAYASRLTRWAEKLWVAYAQGTTLEQGDDTMLNINDKLRKVVMDYNNDQYRALSKALSDGSVGKTKDTSADLAGRVSNDNNKQGSN